MFGAKNCSFSTKVRQPCFWGTFYLQSKHLQPDYVSSYSSSINEDFCSRSRLTKKITAGIWLIFRGYFFERNLSAPACNCLNCQPVVSTGVRGSVLFMALFNLFKRFNHLACFLFAASVDSCMMIIFFEKILKVGQVPSQLLDQIFNI